MTLLRFYGRKLLERNTGYEWRVVSVNGRDSGFWKGVCSVATVFGRQIRYRAYSGSYIFFWLDKWVGDFPLAHSFPMLFALAANKDITVRYCYEIIHNKVVWGSQFRRQMEYWMVDSWLPLMKLLEIVFVVGSGMDGWIWEIDPHGYFSVCWLVMLFPFTQKFG